MVIDRVPKQEHPRLFDVVVGEIQDGIAANIAWLDHIFGKAERLVKVINGKKYYSPNIYVGGNDYFELSPDSNVGNFCFFVLDEPQKVIFERGELNEVKAPFSLIVWFDMRKVLDEYGRNIEAVKRQLLRTLNGEIMLKTGKMTINTIYERVENIFQGFTLDEVDNQFLMQPYCGFRFKGELLTIDECL